METGFPMNNQKNEGPYHISSGRNKFWDSVFDWIKTIAIALLISLPIRFFIAEPFIVNGASMDPTFATGQFLIVDRLSYRFEAPKRGDVIVFKYPNNPSVYYIKRIIGLPGEIIALDNGKVKVCNDQKCLSPLQTLDEPYVASSHYSYDTLRFTLGNDEYFVLGDNRAQSSDSRIWGTLKADLIIGRPIIRLLPVNEISILPGEHREK